MLAALLLAQLAAAGDDWDPYAPAALGRLETPQWVGEEGVDAVVVLSIDDMRDPGSYEAFLRPILDRLHGVEGRAPVSIFVNTVDPGDPQLATWLDEGLSLEVHTVDHPCPLLGAGGFGRAASTYHRCVDLLAGVPGTEPVAFRMPCCDSMNSVSPRFFAEIFARTSSGGRFLRADSSVFQLFTASDPELPRELVLLPDGTERFRRYLPLDRGFVNWVEDHPYPWVVGGVCWELPCVVPSDWEAQHLRGPNHPDTVEDLAAALDATVVKRGLFVYVFHPHGWMTSAQVVELIDHAVATHGDRVRFLSMRDVVERLEANALGGRSLRAPDGSGAGIEVRDLDGDGLVDVALPGGARMWRPSEGRWEEVDAAPDPAPAFEPPAPDLDPAALRHFDLDADGRADALYSDGERAALWLAQGDGWREVPLLADLPPFVLDGGEAGVFTRGRELLVQNERSGELPGQVERRAFADLFPAQEARALEPEAARRAFELAPGLRVELVAAEPLVLDPVALDWGADGRLWVAEMADYPVGAQGGGRVRVLADSDGDGRYEASTVFLDGLRFPSGVMPWRDGALVSSAPQVLFAADRDGDGRAEVVQPLLTGFAPGNPQHRVNGFRWGLDNWVHAANGDSGGVVVSSRTGAVTRLGSHDLRFRPDGGEVDLLNGPTQFGRVRDDWGRWFVANNFVPLRHDVIPDRYLRRNPHLAPPDPLVRVMEGGANFPVFPIAPLTARFNDLGHVGRSTSTCGPCIYRDALLGEGFAGDAFVCEPVHNLVHRQDLVPEGATFAGRRAPGEAAREVLASPDPWFRPVQVRTGPDGALWIADMYRQVIEHPEWISDDREARLDLFAGSDRGRIWRLLPVGGEARAVPALDGADFDALAAALAHRNGRVRDQAHQLLFERGAGTPEQVGRLEDTALRHGEATARLHALCVLEGWGSLGPELVGAALGDPHAGVRRQAVRLAEGFLAAHAPLARALLPLAADPETGVRLQVALALGASDDPAAAPALARLLFDPDRWVRTGAASSVRPGTAAAVLAAVLAAGDPTAEVLAPLLAPALQASDGAAFEALARDLTASERPRPMRLRAGVALLEAAAGLGRGGELGVPLGGLLDEAAALVADAREPLEQRVAAARLLALAPGDRLQALAPALAPTAPLEVQRAAADGLAGRGDRPAAELLLAGLDRYGPDLRARVVDALLARTPWTAALVEALEAGRAHGRDLSAAQRQRLLRDPEQGARAAELFEPGAASPRAEVVARLGAGIEGLAGDVQRGDPVFRRLCATCHALGGAGTHVGPDLAALTDRSDGALLVAVLDPHRAVESTYRSYDAWLRDGRVLSGMLVSEAGGAVTLVNAQGERVAVPRAELEDLRASPLSLMPEGLEADLAAQDLADLFAFLRAHHPPRLEFPGNAPRTVRPDSDTGVLHLTVAAAELYGSALVFEPRYGNAGYWSGPDDSAAWTIEVPEAGAFEVHLDHACHDASAGNALVVASSGGEVAWTVVGTGTWDDYREVVVGVLDLAAGTQRVTVRPAGDPEPCLIDLRAVRLVPAP